MKPENSPSTQTHKVVEVAESKPAEPKSVEGRDELRAKAGPDDEKEGHSVNPDPVPPDPGAAEPDLSALIRDGIAKVTRKLLDEPPPPSAWQRIYTNPLAGILLTFILMGLVVAYMTYQFNRSLEELKFQHSEALKELELRRGEALKLLEFQRADDQRKVEYVREDERRESDRLYQEQQKQVEYLRGLQQMREELFYARRQKDLDYSRQMNQGYVEYTRNLSAITNSTRVQKAGAVLERVGRTESEIERLLDRLTTGSSREDGPERRADVDRIDELRTQLSDMLEEFGPYLRPRISARLREYMQINGDYIIERLVNGKTRQELGPLLLKREDVKPTINDIKNIVLEDERQPAGPSEQPPG
jgi:hypothetical protein